MTNFSDATNEVRKTMLLLKMEIFGDPCQECPAKSTCQLPSADKELCGYVVSDWLEGEMGI